MWSLMAGAALADVGTLWREDHTFVELGAGVAAPGAAHLSGTVGVHHPIGGVGLAVAVGADHVTGIGPAAVARVRVGPALGVLLPYGSAQAGVGAPWPAPVGGLGLGLAVGLRGPTLAVEGGVLRRGPRTLGTVDLRVGWAW